MPESNGMRAWRHAIRGLLACLTLWLAPPLCAQAQPDFAPANFDPSDVYFQGYLATRAGEQLEASGNFIAAADKYRKARELFGTVRKYYPEWKPDMVNRRSEKNQSALAQAEQKAQKQLEEKRSAVAELEGGLRVGAESIGPSSSTPGIDPAPSILKVDPVASRRLKEAQEEVERLRQELARQMAENHRLESHAQSNGNQAEIQRLRTLSDRQRAEAETEINALRREALIQQAHAEAEIKRLRALTGETRQNAEDKIKQLEQLAANANASANAEIERIKQLGGKEKKDAEAEIQRLRQVAEKARNDAASEVAKLREMSQKSQSSQQAELEKAQREAIKAKAEAETRQFELERLKHRDLAAADQRRQLEDRLKAAEANVSKLQSRLAKVPVESQLLGLNHKIKQLEQERQAMALSLQQTQSGYTQSMDRIAGLESELQKARQEAADLNRNLQDQQSTANAVVAGQRKQLEALQLQLKEKSDALTAAQEEIGSLKRELGESREAFRQLREERDALLVERDQMAALLKLNEGGRIQEMVEQNMALNKNLREANEKLDRIYRESNADKDQITEALRDLAIAKSQINRLHQEKKEQEQRLEELEARLRQEQEALASGKASADPAEVQLLRDIIKRQLGVQSRRIQTRNLLVDAAKKLGTQDPQLAEAIALFDREEIVLTPEEQKLIADREVDGEFISPYARSRSAVEQSTESLNQEIATYERAAQKSFLAGRLMPARELYELILEQHPGHVATLCKLGVVQLKLKDTEAAADAFRRAVELANQHPYALRMLAYSLMKSGRLEDAEQAARESVKIAPNDDKAHMLLATLCFELGQQGDAEAHFKGAINANPLPSEPYYNLALIYSSSGRIEKAKEFYHQALKRGALPDPDLEKTLSMQ